MPGLLSWLGGAAVGGSGIALGWRKARTDAKAVEVAAEQPAVEATKAAFDGLVSTVEALRLEVERLRAEREADDKRAAQRERDLVLEVARLRFEVSRLRQTLADHGIAPPASLAPERTPTQ